MLALFEARKMKRKFSPSFLIKGDAYERGYQHGSLAKHLVKENLEAYLRLKKEMILTTFRHLSRPTRSWETGC